MADALLGLSWQIQLAVASGYAAYLLCYVGIRAKHSTVDVTFLSLIFGLIASASLYIAQQHMNVVAAGATAFFLTCGCGLLWRRFFRSLLRKLLRKWNVSWSDDSPTTLALMLSETHSSLSQISIQLEDGSWLICNDLQSFKKSPFGPCLIGQDGDMAIYLTHTISKDGVEREVKNVKDADYGDRITFVPASKIKMINFRHING
ncbi:hypothetical protein [Methylobacterium sp. 10]|uniref:hypothetical protein n=1 Tax=Methylobacterium sp. 10 TaxID=1101191 RepID=UPI0012DD6615|nr:hypothetical protein [Methylobacterium sp. 10]